MMKWYLRDLSRKQRTAIQARGKSGKPAANCAIYGYMKDPSDKYRWLIDQEAAAVVRRIFQLTIVDRGLYETTAMLCEEKVETPTIYFTRQGRGCAEKQRGHPPSGRLYYFRI